MGLTISNAASTPVTKEPNADYEATKTNETEFQNGFGSSDGNGKQQRMEATDTVQCNAINMVKGSALRRTYGPRKTTGACHMQGSYKETTNASICDDLWCTSVAHQKHSQWHGTVAEAVQSLHFKTRTSDDTQTYATDAQCRCHRSHTTNAPTDEG